MESDLWRGEEGNKRRRWDTTRFATVRVCSTLEVCRLLVFRLSYRDPRERKPERGRIVRNRDHTCCVRPVVHPSTRSHDRRSHREWRSEMGESGEG